MQIKLSFLFCGATETIAALRGCVRVHFADFDQCCTNMNGVLFVDLLGVIVELCCSELDHRSIITEGDSL
jgi:hypothetical protein